MEREMCICAVREGMYLKNGNTAEGIRRMPAGEENLSGNKKDGYTVSFSVSVFVTCR